MKLKPPPSNNTATGAEGWESLQSHLNRKHSHLSVTRSID